MEPPINHGLAPKPAPRSWDGRLAAGALVGAGWMAP